MPKKFDPSEWAKKRKGQVARAKEIRELRSRRDDKDGKRGTGKYSSRNRNVKGGLLSGRSVSSTKSRKPQPRIISQSPNLTAPGMAQQTTTSKSSTGNAWVSMDELLKQTMASMDSLDKLSDNHQRQFIHKTSTVSRQNSSPTAKSHVATASDVTGGPSRLHAARSYEQNDKYIKNWNEAYKNLQASINPSTTSGRRGVMNAQPARKEVAARSARRRRGNLANAAGGIVRNVGGAMEKLSLGSVLEKWRKGPDESILGHIELETSERPILCMSVQDDEAVVGSSDHALYVYDLSSGSQARRLYNRRNGHSEWVTCVCHLPDGKILSGGMDSKLFVWPTGSTTSYELKGHTQSISAVAASHNSMYALSGSYDKTVRIWDCKSRKQVACLKGHKAPVTSLDMGPMLAVSGSKDGIAMAWDLEEGKSIGALKGHKGHITAVRWLAKKDEKVSQSCVFLTGAQDGHVRIWDLRRKKALGNISAHVSSRGCGAVGGIEVSGDGNTVVTMGADRKVCMLDVRKGFEVRFRAGEHKDFIYGLKVVEDLAISGGGDGMVHCHSTKEDKAMWSISPFKNAIRCIGVSPHRLVVTGDDGSAKIYSFN